jgi:hypothetical protein
MVLAAQFESLLRPVTVMGGQLLCLLLTLLFTLVA